MSIDNILYSKCFEDQGHVERIKKWALKFAEILGMDKDSAEVMNLNMLAGLHDIGKVGIPKEILMKSDTLTENEQKIIRSYTEIGFRMAQSIEEPILAQAILYLRENWDGSGYPYGLKYQQIPYIARIISILDVFDIITRGRPYKSALSKKDAMKELKNNSGTQFDPELIDTFINNIDYIIGESKHL